MSSYAFRRFFLVALLLLAVSSPAHALEQRTGSVSCLVTAPKPAAYAVGSPLWADFWSIGHFFTSGGRTRIVQTCVVAMCIALFFMRRKLNG
jgi:hypothetical protein